MRAVLFRQLGAGAEDERQSRRSGPRKTASSRSVSSTVRERSDGLEVGEDRRQSVSARPTADRWLVADKASMAGGSRIDPPPSVPIAAGTKRAATLAAAPPLEPPGVRSCSTDCA